jgi:20S proteasome alpha/beta subunit
MTIVLGMKVDKDEKERANSLDDYLVLAADSMGSITHCDRKTDDTQKLYVIGENKDFLLMGAGTFEGVVRVVHEIEDMHFNTLQDVSKKILNVTEKRDIVNERDVLDFIVGGKYAADGKKRLELGFAEINVTGYDPCLKRSRWSDRGYTIQPRFTVDGAGQEYVLNYMEGLVETGKGYNIDLATAFVLAYEFSKKGAKDSSVNDKLQFGVITKDGVSTSYHPEIMLYTEKAFVRYLNQMSGLNLPLLREELEGENKKKMMKVRSDLSDMLNLFYDQFITDLREYADCRRWYTTYSEVYANDDTAKDDFEEMRARRARAKGNVLVGVNALVARGIPAILDYAKNFDERKKQLEERILKLPEEYKK